MEDFVAYFYTKLPRNLMPHIQGEAGVCEKIFRSVYSTVDKRYFTFSFKRNTCNKPPVRDITSFEDK